MHPAYRLAQIAQSRINGNKGCPLLILTALKTGDDGLGQVNCGGIRQRVGNMAVKTKQCCEIIIKMLDGGRANSSLEHRLNGFDAMAWQLGVLANRH